MAKKLTTIKLHIAGGEATPAPPIGPALAQHGINIGDFCKQFNDKTQEQKGFTIPVVVDVYDNKSFTFKAKTPITSELLKKEVGIEKGSGVPNRKKVGSVNKSQIKKVAQQKMPDLNADTLDEAMKIIEGTAQNMGLRIK